MKNQILEFFKSVGKVVAKQKQNKCPISKKEYYEKIPYNEAAPNLFKEEKQSLIKWVAKRNKDNIFVLLHYAGIGICVYVVDYEKKQWIDITDYSSW